MFKNLAMKNTHFYLNPQIPDHVLFSHDIVACQ